MSSITRWCPTCQEDCLDHSTICTICGTALQASSSVRVVPPQVEQDVRAASQNLASLLSNLRTQVQDLQTTADATGDAVARLRQVVEQGGDAWQNVPAEAMDPQQAGSSRSRGTAKATLASLPRITIQEDCFLFHQANLAVDGREFGAILGEFGPTPKQARGALVIAEPLTGLGGLNSTTIDTVKKSDSAIMYMERGDGITFVKKALMAQDAGASAVVVGNHQATPWPYVMKDSKGEAITLKIPVVMVKQTDGHILVGLAGKQCHLNVIKNQKDECVICRDAFETGQKVIQLPACGHAFHEACALAWLTHHCACPFCRRELPTDDAEYEAERRRTQRTHAGSERTSSEWNDFYG